MLKKRNKKELKNKLGLSYRFLCSHHKKDAILAATLSIGAILVCFILNIKFNFTEIITDSYRDNMGYSVGIRVTELEGLSEIQNKLDVNEYKYTLAYSKLTPYNILNGKETMEGEFWAAIVGESTDNNKHFSVTPGEFAVESYFSNYANVFIIGSMLIYVIFIFFYSVIQSNLISRKSEIVLYQIYGASHVSAKMIVYQEYLMIALIPSFSVVFTVMIFGLSSKVRLFPKQLSGGEQQRTAIARSLVNQPSILFADEPTGALDKKTGDGIVKYLMECSRQLKMTVVLVTHDMGIANQCDRIIHMEDRKIFV